MKSMPQSVIDFICPEALQVNRVSRPGLQCVKALDSGNDKNGKWKKTAKELCVFSKDNERFSFEFVKFYSKSTEKSFLLFSSGTEESLDQVPVSGCSQLIAFQLWPAQVSNSTERS